MFYELRIEKQTCFVEYLDIHPHAFTSSLVSLPIPWVFSQHHEWTFSDAIGVLVILITTKDIMLSLLLFEAEQFSVSYIEYKGSWSKDFALVAVRVLLLPVARMPVFCRGTPSSMWVVVTCFVHLGEESQCRAQFHVERKTMVTKEAGVVQWWEYLPSTNVAHLQFPDSASYVDWVCWFSTLLR